MSADVFHYNSDPCPDPVAGLRAGLEGVQVDAFVFQRPPEPFDHPVVDPAAAAVHRDLHLGVAQHVGEAGAGELRALVGAEYLRWAVSGQRLFQCFDAETGIHRVRQPPVHQLPAVPVHDGDQVKEPAPHRNVGDVGTPNLIGAGDNQVPDKIGINLVFRMLLTGLGLLVDRHQAHGAHQPPHPVRPQGAPA